jgi:hypothetical protein
MAGLIAFLRHFMNMPCNIVVDRRKWLIQVSCLLVSEKLHLSNHAQNETKSPFWNILKRLDDPPTGPSSADNLMTNEDSVASVVDEISKVVPKGQVYLGVGPDQNYSLMAHLEPSYGFILDYRKKNQLLHLLQKALVENSADRHAYLEHFWNRNLPELPLSLNDIEKEFKILAKQPQNELLVQSAKELVTQTMSKWNILNDKEFHEIATIQARLAGPGPDARFLALKMYPTLGSLITMPSRSGQPSHWLASDRTYAAIRKMQLSDQILPIVGDWAGPGAIRRLAEHLKMNQLQVGCIYISDVEFFLLRGGLFQKYLENLSALPRHPESKIIRTSTRELNHTERVSGRSSTTVVRSLSRFLKSAKTGKIESWEDLFDVL